MTNPNNAVGTNGAYGGRTSVNAFNDDLGFYTRGVTSGWACSTNTGMTVKIGGVSGTRDVAVAQDNAGNKTTVNNISGSPINVTIATAPSTNSRIDAIVGYVDNPPTGSATAVDNPAACGIIAVKGTVASSPVAPNDSAIRTAITADGASGATAYYVVLATITVGTNVTTITSGNITQGSKSTMSGANITNGTINAAQLASNSVTTAKINSGAVTNAKIGSAAVKSSNIDWSTMPERYSTTEIDTGYTWIDGRKIYKKTIDCGNLPNNDTKTINHNISNMRTPIKIEGLMLNSAQTQTWAIPYQIVYNLSVNQTSVFILDNADLSSFVAYVTIYYTKN